MPLPFIVLCLHLLAPECRHHFNLSPSTNIIQTHIFTNNPQLYYWTGHMFCFLYTQPFSKAPINNITDPLPRHKNWYCNDCIIRLKFFNVLLILIPNLPDQSCFLPFVSHALQSNKTTLCAVTSSVLDKVDDMSLGNNIFLGILTAWNIPTMSAQAILGGTVQVSSISWSSHWHHQFKVFSLSSEYWQLLVPVSWCSPVMSYLRIFLLLHCHIAESRGNFFSHM